MFVWVLVVILDKGSIGLLYQSNRLEEGNDQSLKTSVVYEVSVIVHASMKFPMKRTSWEDELRVHGYLRMSRHKVAQRTYCRIGHNLESLTTPIITQYKRMGRSWNGQWYRQRVFYTLTTAAESVLNVPPCTQLARHAYYYELNRMPKIARRISAAPQINGTHSSGAVSDL